jgi:hypothetical protein
MHETSMPEARPFEERLPQVGVIEVGMVQVGFLENRPDENGTPKSGLRKLCFR